MRYEEFSKQLKSECGLNAEKLDIIYNDGDSRCWTALIGKKTSNLLVTFHVNRGHLGDKNFDIIGSRKLLVEVPQYEIFEVLSEITPLEDTE